MIDHVAVGPAAAVLPERPFTETPVALRRDVGIMEMTVTGGQIGRHVGGIDAAVSVRLARSDEHRSALVRSNGIAVARLGSRSHRDNK